MASVSVFLARYRYPFILFGRRNTKFQLLFMGGWED